MHGFVICVCIIQELSLSKETLFMQKYATEFEKLCQFAFKHYELIETIIWQTLMGSLEILHNTYTEKINK